MARLLQPGINSGWKCYTTHNGSVPPTCELDLKTSRCMLIWAVLGVINPQSRMMPSRNLESQQVCGVCSLARGWWRPIVRTWGIFGERIVCVLIQHNGINFIGTTRFGLPRRMISCHEITLRGSTPSATHTTSAGRGGPFFEKIVYIDHLRVHSLAYVAVAKVERPSSCT